MAMLNDGWLESSDVMPMFPTLGWKLQLKAEFHQPMDERHVLRVYREPEQTAVVTTAGFAGFATRPC